MAHQSPIILGVGNLCRKLGSHVSMDQLSQGACLAYCWGWGETTLLIGQEATELCEVMACMPGWGRSMVEMLPTAILLVLAVSVVAKDNFTCE